MLRIKQENELEQEQGHRIGIKIEKEDADEDCNEDLQNYDVNFANISKECKIKDDICYNLHEEIDIKEQSEEESIEDDVAITNEISQNIQCDLNEQLDAEKQYLNLYPAIPNSYDCDMCQAKFPLLLIMENHKRTHICKDYLSKKCNAVQEGKRQWLSLDATVINSYECDICHDSFPLLLMMENHKRTHIYLNESQQEECQILEQKEDTQVSDIELCKNKTANCPCKFYQCDICHARFTKMSAMENHYQVQHTGLFENEEQKPVDEPNPKEQAVKTQNITRKRNRKTYVCSICSEKLANIAALEYHKQCKHPEIQKQTSETQTAKKKRHRKPTQRTGKLLKCPYCEETFEKPTYLWWHKKNRHDLKPCLYCNKTVLKEEYSAHKATHVKTFTCEQCNHKFYTANFLKVHIRKCHSEKSPEDIMCHLCGKLCTGQNAYRYHLLQHQGKKFECELCGALFNLEKRLKRHMGKHERRVDVSKPYSCDVCMEGFSAGTSLWRHKKRFHPKKPKEEKITNYFTDDYFKPKSK